MHESQSVNPTLYLASASPRRRELIRAFQLPVELVASNVDETVSEALQPAQIVETLSQRKARASLGAAAGFGKPGAVIGSDTIVVLDGEVLGKPKDRAHAVIMLSALQGRSHSVYTGVCCIDVESRIEKTAHSATTVHMRALSPARIQAYIETGEPMDKAGDYDTTMHLGDIGQYRVLSESENGMPEVIVGHTVSKVTFRPMSDEEIRAYINTGEPLDKAGSYGVQGLGALFY